MSEYRFAARVDPIDPAGSAATVGASPPTLRRAVAGALAFLRGISGLDAYERYATHQRRAHPEAPVLSEAEFWRRSWDESARHPKARCC